MKSRDVIEETHGTGPSGPLIIRHCRAGVLPTINTVAGLNRGQIPNRLFHAREVQIGMGFPIALRDDVHGIVRAVWKMDSCDT